MNWQLLWKTVKRRFKEIITDENLYLRFFALFLAVVLWFLATGEGRFGTSERLVSVPLQIEDLPADFALVSEPEPVRVRIRALNPLLGVAEQQIVATANLSEAIEGEGTYGVEVQTPTGVDVVNISPRWIRLQTERILEGEFPVTVALVGLPPEQGIQSLVPNPATVVVTAPRSVLQQINQVVAYISLSGATSRLEGNFPLRATDERGRILDKVEIRPEQVRVVLQQVTQQNRVELPVVPQLQGNLPDNLEITNVQVEPPALPVLLNNNAVGVQQLVTRPITLADLTVGEIRRDVEVVLPQGVQPLGAATVNVRLLINEIVEQPDTDDQESDSDEAVEEDSEPESGSEEPLLPIEPDTEDEGTSEPSPDPDSSSDSSAEEPLQPLQPLDENGSREE